MISIIIPVYNSEKYLGECLSSVASQTYQKWECILIDDGSTDDSLSICETWRKRDDRFIIISQINQGVSAARNVGLKVASKKYVVFIDSDDRVSFDYLESLITMENSDLVVSGINGFSDETKIKYMYIPDHTMRWRLENTYTKEFVDLNKKYLLFGVHTKLYQMEIINNNSIRFPENCSYGEDLVFNYKYLECTRTILCVAQAKYFYRLLQGSLSRKYRYDQFETDYCHWKMICSFFKRKGFEDSYAKEFIYEQLWGIVYDSLFGRESPLDNKWSKIQTILSIPEIVILKQYQRVFPCATWIKKAICFRLTIVFYIYNLVFKKKMTTTQS
jgi:glycosyltransferase involved in cell wall biosynthesis